MSQWIIDAFKTGLNTCGGCNKTKPFKDFFNNHYCTEECIELHWSNIEKQLKYQKDKESK